MTFAHAIARWFRRCFAWATAADRGVIESDLQDLDLTLRRRRRRVRGRRPPG